MYKPDSVDKKIIQLIGQDARQNSEELAKKLKLSSATVRRRLKKLFQSELLRVIGVIDPACFGLPVVAIINLDVDHDKLEQAMETLVKQAEIQWVSTATGRFDIIGLGRFRSNNSLSDFIKKVLAPLEGLKNSETFICLDIKKGRYAPLV